MKRKAFRFPTVAALCPLALVACQEINRPMPEQQLIAKGRELFFNETFDGNGRTCGTCHPSENNFTIDPSFVARLPSDDPLFVAENNPELAKLERPTLMRRTREGARPHAGATIAGRVRKRALRSPLGLGVDREPPAPTRPHDPVRRTPQNR